MGLPITARPQSEGRSHGGRTFIWAGRCHTPWSESPKGCARLGAWKTEMHGMDTSLTEQVCPGRQADGINTSTAMVLAEDTDPVQQRSSSPTPRCPERDPGAAEKFLPCPKVSRETPRCSKEVPPPAPRCPERNPGAAEKYFPCPKVSRDRPWCSKNVPPTTSRCQRPWSL